MIFSCGFNEDGQLGQGTTSTEASAKSVIGIPDVEQIRNLSLGRSHAALVNSQGSVFTWGSNEHGKLGQIPARQTTPQLVKCLSNIKMKSAHCGNDFTIFLTDCGLLMSVGSNQYGQLGIMNGDTPILKEGFDSKEIELLHSKYYCYLSSKKSKRVKTESSKTCFVKFRKENHSEYIKKAGSTAESKIDILANPILIDHLENIPIEKVATGNNHCFALATNGFLYGWGDNGYGQVSPSILSTICYKPYLIPFSVFQVIIDVACGEHHSCALTKEGKVYVWGRWYKKGFRCIMNSPSIISMSHFVTKIASGDNHLLFLTNNGHVLSAGEGFFGQLGLNTKENEEEAVIIHDFLGELIDMIACGRKHSLVYSSETGNLYGFGYNNNGQVTNFNNGSSNEKILARPLQIMKNRNIKGVFCGSDYSMIFETDQTGPLLTFSARPDPKFIFSSPILILKYLQTTNTSNYHSIKDIEASIDDCLRVLVIHAESMNNIHFYLKAFIPILKRDYKKNESSIRKFIHLIAISGDHLFPLDSPKLLITFLNGYLSFLLKQKRYSSSISQQTVDPCLLLVCEILKSCYTFLDTKNHYDLYASNKDESKVSFNDFYNTFVSEKVELKIEYFHWYFFKEKEHHSSKPILMYIPLRDSVCLHYDHLVQEKIFSFCDYPFLLDTEAKSQLLKIDACRQMFHSMNNSFFQNFLSILDDDDNGGLRFEMSNDGRQRSSTESVLNRSDISVSISLSHIDESVLPNSSSASPMSTNTTDSSRSMLRVFPRRAAPNNNNVPSTSTAAESTANNENREQPRSAEQRDPSIVFSFFFNPEQSYLTLVINRATLMKDTFDQLKLINKEHELKKPLKIIFQGEEGLDEGGITKEFFYLITKLIFGEKNGVFINENNYAWFNSKFLKHDEMQLVGILFGLAVYNSCLLNVNFPSLFFKKLLNYKVNYQDFSFLYPTISKSLNYLITYDNRNNDFEQVFGLYFQISTDSQEAIDLKPGGSEEAVSYKTKSQYIDLYINYLCNESIKEQYSAFAKGFKLVCDGPILNFFLPCELELLMKGDPELQLTESQLEEFQRKSVYKNGYSKDHKVIKNFWTVFHSFSSAMKQAFFIFLTGSNRFPIKGLSSIPFIIQRVVCSLDRLPVAHTCFNILDLPEYADVQSMEEKLVFAIQNTEGFGLV